MEFLELYEAAEAASQESGNYDIDFINSEVLDQYVEYVDIDGQHHVTALQLTIKVFRLNNEDTSNLIKAVNNWRNSKGE